MMPNTHLKLSLKRTDPGLWLSRVILLASTKPLQPIREISLHCGLNIIWGMDEDGGAEDRIVVAGHGVGKTTFCRLLRYCLGEATFGTKRAREQIRLAFPQGYVGAEIHLQGGQWAVARPIGTGRLSYAAKDVTVEELLDNRPGSDSYHKFRDVIEDAILGDLAKRTVAGSKHTIRWEHLLAWCTRDQEARFQSIWQWRSPRSESETPAFERPKADSLYVMRAVFGLLTGEEVNLTERLATVQQEIAETERNIVERQKEPEYWSRHYAKRLKGLLGIDQTEDIRLAQNGLFGLSNRISIEKDRLTKEADAFYSEITDLDEKISEISAGIQAVEKELTLLTSLLGTTQAGLNELEAGVIDKQRERKELKGFDTEICTYGKVFLRDCEYIRRRINLLTLSEAVDSKHAEKVMVEREKAILELRNDISQQESVVAELRQQRQELLEERRKLQDQRELIMGQKQELLATFEELESWTDLLDGKRVDTVQFDLQRKLNLLNEEKGGVQAQLADLLKSHSEHIEELRRVFDDTVKEALSKDYSGMVTFDRGELNFQITYGETLAGEAIDTLTILLGDMSAVILGMCGRGHHPGFLVHDSPREADLGVRVYHGFLRFVAELHSRCGGANQAPFQYIVTTTTTPPEELQAQEFVRVKLDARSEAGLLFRKRIGVTSPGHGDSRQLLLSDLTNSG
ncbi:MAG: hypothetical protein JW883_16245 [Deltaproteobacteria bacterium]|nr:hypothetical protein [Deltaproteobacteria bacterium]